VRPVVVSDKRNFQRLVEKYIPKCCQ
jgi:hypothetical protein